MVLLIRGRIMPEDSQSGQPVCWCWIYRPFVAWVLGRAGLTLAAGRVAADGATWPACQRLGTEFMPPL